MSIKAVLFDLDGTLLPMDLDVFIKGYFGALTKGMAARGFDAKRFSKALLAGVDAMMKNEGTDTNENIFWQTFEAVYGEEARSREELFNEFYRGEFQSLSALCGTIPEAATAVRAIRDMGIRVVLATNPVFPMAATERRIKWAGLSKDDFELVTTYENSRFCKPSLDYYRDIVKTLGVSPEECLMVGNDALEDMITEKLGMKVFLLTKCLINKEEKDISGYPQGSLEDLVKFVKAI